MFEIVERIRYKNSTHFYKILKNKFRMTLRQYKLNLNCNEESNII